MWHESTMGLGMSLLMSVMGMVVVFIALILLAVMIIIVSKALNAIVKEKPAAAAAAPVAVPAAAAAATGDNVDEESYAVLMAAVCEEIGASPDTFQITEIKEMK